MSPGEIGALLRREGLFSSQLTMWRKLYQRGARRALSRTLPAATQAEALAYLHDDRFGDAAPAQVHATLLDDGVYVSVRTT